MTPEQEEKQVRALQKIASNLSDIAFFLLLIMICQFVGCMAQIGG